VLGVTEPLCLPDIFQFVASSLGFFIFRPGFLRAPVDTYIDYGWGKTEKGEPCYGQPGRVFEIGLLCDLDSNRREVIL